MQKEGNPSTSKIYEKRGCAGTAPLLKSPNGAIYFGRAYGLLGALCTGLGALFVL